MPIISFSHLNSSEHLQVIPDGYKGLDWDSFIAADKTYINQDSGHRHSGYASVLHGDALAFIGQSGATADGLISDGSGTFTLKSGIFGSAWNDHVSVRFTAFFHGEAVGHKHVFLDTDAKEIVFGASFRHIDAIEIVGRGGVDHNPHDGNDGVYLAMDNLRVVFDAIAAALPDHIAAEPQFGVHSAGEWALV